MQIRWDPDLFGQSRTQKTESFFGSKSPDAAFFVLRKKLNIEKPPFCNVLESFTLRFSVEHDENNIVIVWL
jgi:hypothetical protein